MSVLQDLRQAVRIYRRSPGLTAIALLSIALTTGATAVVFAAIKSVLISPLPYKDAGALVQLRTDYTRVRPHYDWVSWADMQDVKAANRSFEALATYHYALVSLTGDANHAPESLYGLYISADLFPMLGVKPMLGRNILPEETQQGRDREMILSDGVWRRRFNSDQGVIGRSIEIDGHAWTIVGVMGPGFDFPLRHTAIVKTPSQHMDFWAPEAVDPVKLGRTGGYCAVARLKPGSSLAGAQQDLDAISAELARRYPRSNADHVIRFTPLRAQTFGFARAGLWLLMGAALLFLLIGCANVANLLLARSFARQREIAVRLALGAGAKRILRQLITESCVLALAGGVGGYGLAALAWTLLPLVAPMSIPRLDAARADGGVLAFTIAVSVLNGILFGLTPALRCSRRDPANSLRESASRGSIGAASNRLRSSLVVVEVTIAVMLVIIGGRLTATFVHLLRTDPGFDSKHVLASIVAASADQYRTPEGHEMLFRRILESVRALPGVESAGVVDALPFSGENNGSTVSRADDPDVTLPEHGQIAEFDHVSPGYLEAMGIRLLDGRWFREDDLTPGRDVAIVNDFLAKRLWPGESALGKQICLNCSNEKFRERKRVIGVVETIRHSGLDEPIGMEVYETDKAYRYADFFVVRTQRPAREMANAVRLAVASVDPKQPVFLSASISQFIGDSVADRRFIMTLLAITGFLALLLAAAGVYGVISYTTSLRTSEIGLRMALGASPGNVQALIFRGGMRLASFGIVLGLIIALVTARVLRNMLAGLASNDPLLVALAIALVLAAASLACWIPARRATRIDPMLALRDE